MQSKSKFTLSQHSRIIMPANREKYDLIVILGPTASGKTRLAALLAAKTNSEIISADSRQVYKKMDLGTGKDYNDYIVNNTIIPVHLIDIHTPGYKYNVFEYQQDFFKVYHTIIKKKKIPVLCGGTGMYIDAVTRGYKLKPVCENPALRKSLEEKSLDELKEILVAYKELHNKTDLDTRKRAIRAIEIEEFYLHDPQPVVKPPQLHPVFLGIRYEREILRKRITDRLLKRLHDGMIEEVDTILREGTPPDDLIYYGLEYKYITLFLTGKLIYDEMFAQLNISIQQFAKRQMTWFRKMEREGCKIHWIDGSIPENEKIEFTLMTIKQETS